MKKIALIGSTGSIGRQAIICAARYPDRFKIVSLAAGANAALLGEQIRLLKPSVAALADPKDVEKTGPLPSETALYTGENASLHAIVEDADLVFVAVMGFAGLKVVMEAVRLKKNVAIANKETLVAGGEIVTKLAKESGVELIPVDSEHSALW
ncbi:MAG: 1-deoxy-D-xylulose-5-phosphate reductoisomerase, partial [Clostridia bacterium]|nr:1-deoxy-D-xylulose-5-phosphate reductoisomerase [Clostridia bacterium]